MTLGKFYYNGTVSEPLAETTGIASLLTDNYIYATVNTLRHRPLYLERHLHYAATSYEKLYGVKPEIDAGEMAAKISRILRENRMPAGGNIVNIFLIPPKNIKNRENPDIVVAMDQTTIYSGYGLISIRPKAIITNYEIPFSGHRTAVSLTAARYMDEFAIRSGTNIALRANRAGKLVSCGDYPVFGVKDKTVIVPPPENGTGNSVERDLMLKVCKMTGTATVTNDIELENISELDELMVFNHTGILSVLACNDIYFYNVIALTLEKFLDNITAEG